MSFSIFVLVLGCGVLAVLAGVVAFYTKGNHTLTQGIKEEGRGMEMLKTVYIYIVLLATLMMTIGGSVAAFMAVADIVAPPAYYQTFEEYSRSPEKVTGQPVGTGSQEDLKKNYDAMVSQQRQLAKERALNSLIKAFGWIVIPLPVFIYYQRKLKDRPQA